MSDRVQVHPKFIASVYTRQILIPETEELYRLVTGYNELFARLAGLDNFNFLNPEHRKKIRKYMEGICPALPVFENELGDYFERAGTAQKNVRNYGQMSKHIFAHIFQTVLRFLF